MVIVGICFEFSVLVVGQWSEQLGFICSVGSCEVSYPHYIDRVYGTKADPLSDCDPGIVVMLLFCYVCILVVRMVYVRDLVKVGILVRMMLCYVIC